MNGGEFRPYRDVFPVRQDVDGDEVDRVIDLAVLQPEFPDIGIGHGHARGLRFHGADVGDEVGGRHLTAQQDLVAHHQRGDDAGVILGEANGDSDLGLVLEPVAAEPDALHDFQSDLGRKRGNLVEAVLDRIGADAVRDLGQLRQILGDLLGGDMRGRHQRRLLAPERCVGNAEQLCAGSIGARGSVIGVASHHQSAAIEPRDIRRSASGVRREIGFILRAGARRITRSVAICQVACQSSCVQLCADNSGVPSRRLYRDAIKL